MGGWVKHQADKRGILAKSKYESFVTSLVRADKKTGWVGKKLIVHLPISVTKYGWRRLDGISERGVLKLQETG